MLNKKYWQGRNGEAFKEVAIKYGKAMHSTQANKMTHMPLNKIGETWLAAKGKSGTQKLILTLPRLLRVTIF